MQPSGGPSPNKKVDLSLLFGVAAYLYLLLFKSPFHPFFFEADQLIFLYNADRMLAGEAIYRDFFQFTFPGCQTLYYLLFSVFGTQYWVLPFAIIVMGCATFWFLLKISQKTIEGPIAYLPPLVFIFFGMRWFGLDGSHRMFSPLFVLIAIWVLIRGRSRLDWAIAGSLCAFASFFTQQRGIIAVASLGIFLLLDTYFGADRKGLIGRVAALSGGFAVTLVVLCLPFVVSAGWQTFYWSTIEYPATYYRFHEQNSVFGFAAGFRDLLNLPGIGKYAALPPAILYSLVVPITPLALLGLFAIRKNRADWDRWRSPMLLCVVSVFTILTTTNPGHLRYFQVGGSSVVLFFWFLRQVPVLVAAERRIAVSVASILILFGMFQIFRVQSDANYVRVDAPRGTVYAAQNEQIGRYIWIGQRTRPGDPVFETTNPYIYFLFALRNPSRFTQIYPTDYTRPEFITGTVEDLTKDPPKFILWQNEYDKTDAERSPGDHTEPLADFVQQRYTPVGQVYNVDNKPVQIWELKSSEQFPE